MKISIIGTRGLPAFYGGFETFAEEISPLFVKAGHEVYVQCDYSDSEIPNLKGVQLFYSPVTKSKNPLRYYCYGIRKALKFSDIIIVTGSPGSLFYFLNLFRRKIILTNTDGIESKRAKWSVFQKAILKLSERIAVRNSDYILADSLSIKDYLKKTYRINEQRIKVIEYGAHINTGFSNDVLTRRNLKYQEYYLVVCRLEPENNIHMIIDGYITSKSNAQLVIVGRITNKRYVRNLLKKYRSDKVIFPGDIYDHSELNSLRFASKAYIHGHSIGGTNPSLLEAMGNSNIVICHDNPFNREVTDNKQLYFSDNKECAQRIVEVENMSPDQMILFRNNSLSRIKDYYNWNNILEKYLELFRLLTEKKKFN